MTRMYAYLAKEFFGILDTLAVHLLVLLNRLDVRLGALGRVMEPGRDGEKLVFVGHC